MVFAHISQHALIFNMAATMEDTGGILKVEISNVLSHGVNLGAHLNDRHEVEYILMKSR